jgi:amino acid transporter
MGGFSNFAISFSIISILTGAVTLYGYGYDMGGPLEMTLGWPIATVFSLLLAASMAELCSAFPTSGAMYHWTAALGSPGLAWFVSWMNLVGLMGMVAGINYSCAQFLGPVVGWPTERTFLLFLLLTAAQAAFNLLRVQWISWMNDASVVVHIVGVLLILGALWWAAPLQPASFLLSRSSGTPYAWVFLLGLLQAHWTFTGFDASAHMAEETEDPRRKAPWGMVLSVAVAGVFGYLLLIMLTLAIRPGGPVASVETPMAIAIFAGALGQQAGVLMSLGVALAMWFCGLSTLVSASRTVYSFARDGGMPGSVYFRSVDAHGVPHMAVVAVAACSTAVMAWGEAVPVVTSMSTVSLYWAYVIPVWLGWRKRQEWVGEAVWTLGRAGWWVNLVAIVYTTFICFILMMPPNALAGKTMVGIVVVLALVWWGGVRRRFAGPDWTRAH